MGGRIIDKSGQDVTAERTTVIPAEGKKGQKDKGEWMRLSKDEADVIRKMRRSEKLDELTRLSQQLPGGYR